MLRYRLPDGRSWKRLWEGWVGSFMMLLVLLEHRARKMSRMDRRDISMKYLSLCEEMFEHFFKYSFFFFAIHAGSRTCEEPASSGPHVWPDDITQWPVRRSVLRLLLLL